MTLAEVAARVRERFGPSTQPCKWIVEQFEADPEFKLPEQVEALAKSLEDEAHEVWGHDAQMGNNNIEFARRLREILERK